MEIAKLDTVASSYVIEHLKSIFARDGIQETVVSDNSPQYAAQEIVKFPEYQGFTHITSSPRYPQSNGKAERAVHVTFLEDVARRPRWTRETCIIAYTRSLNKPYNATVCSNNLSVVNIGNVM